MFFRIISITGYISAATVYIAMSCSVAAAETKFIAGENAVRVAVVSSDDFTPDRIVSDTQLFPSELTERIIEKLTNSKRFIAVERSALRQLIIEQRYGESLTSSFLDRSLNSAIEFLDNVEKGGNKNPDFIGGTNVDIAKLFSDEKARAMATSASTSVAGGKIATTAVLSDYKDILDDFLTLGKIAGAQYIILGNIEKLEINQTSTEVPYSQSGKEFTEEATDARVRLRVVSIEDGAIIGAKSFRAKVTAPLFSGIDKTTDDLSIYDHLADLSANSILDITFPTKVVSLDPLVISRGFNDGVALGDEWVIHSVGEEVTNEQGIVLGRLKRPIGNVQVISMEENYAIVSKDTSATYSLGDLATRAAQPPLAQNAQANNASIGVEIPTLGGDKPRLAIGKVVFSGVQETNEESPQIFTSTLVSALAKTKRFDLVDRQVVDQLLDEQLAEAISKGAIPKNPLGTLVNADYLVLGAVSAFDINHKEIEMPSSNLTFNRIIGHVEGNMRLVNVKTGIVIESRKIVSDINIEQDAKKQTQIAALADAFANTTALELLNAIYPIKVIHIGSDGAVYLNRGGDGGLKNGDTLAGYTLGTRLVDPDSGQQLGFEETYLGEIQLSDVGEQRSKGILFSGSLPTPGDIYKNIVPLKSPFATDSRNSSKPRTMAIKIIDTPDGATANGISDVNLDYLSDLLLPYFSTDFTLVERTSNDLDTLLYEQIATSIITNKNSIDNLSDLTAADVVLMGGVSRLHLRRLPKKIPYTDKYETTTEGYIDGIFKIVDTVTGEIVSVRKISHSKLFDDGVPQEQITNIMLDQYAKKVYLSLTNQEIETNKDSETSKGLETSDKNKSETPKINW